MARDSVFTSYRVGVAAEAFAAAQFARLGYDVSVQYGANQPEYDLMIAKGAHMLKVSVKGSQDGSWGLTQSYLTPGKADYSAAADTWHARHSARTVVCLVQFKGVGHDELPRMYMATPKEVAAQLKKTSSGRGDTMLYELKKWTQRAHGAGTVDAIPAKWRLSKDRVDSLLSRKF
jgi:hypothetical protein